MTTYLQAIDSIQSPETTQSAIPAAVLTAPVVLGYSGGNSWPTFKPYEKARPELAKLNRVIPITLSASAFGHVYDIEPGGGTNANIGVFMHNAVRVWKTPKRWGKPWLYTFASNGDALLSAARSFGYERGRDFYYFSSHAGAGQHICSPHACGFPQADGTQYEFAGAIDRSLVADYMLVGSAQPTPPADPHHYLWFDDTDRDLGSGRHGSERGIVQEYDHKRKHPRLFPGRLRRLRDDLGILAGRLETVMVDQPAANDTNRRPWRHGQLVGRADGRRYV